MTVLTLLAFCAGFIAAALLFGFAWKKDSERLNKRINDYWAMWKRSEKARSREASFGRENREEKSDPADYWKPAGWELGGGDD